MPSLSLRVFFNIFHVLGFCIYLMAVLLKIRISNSEFLRACYEKFMVVLRNYHIIFSEILRKSLNFLMTEIKSGFMQHEE
jgi:hypothetical protein